MLYQASSGPQAMPTHCGPSKPTAYAWRHHHVAYLPPFSLHACIHFILVWGLPWHQAAAAICSFAGGLPGVHCSQVMPQCGSPCRFVSLEDAERTIKTGQPPEMRMEVSATATAPQPARAAVAAATAAEPARAAPARTGAPLQNGPAAESTKVHPTTPVWLTCKAQQDSTAAKMREGLLHSACGYLPLNHTSACAITHTLCGAAKRLRREPVRAKPCDAAQGHARDTGGATEGQGCEESPCCCSAG